MDDPISPGMLVPPAVTALKDNAAQFDRGRSAMERSVSMDIREEREDLKRAAEQSMNAIMELSLDGSIRWMSPSWRELTNTPASEVIGRLIAELILETTDVFAECVEAIRKDDSKSRNVRFSVDKAPALVPFDLPFADGMTPSPYGAPSPGTLLAAVEEEKILEETDTQSQVEPQDCTIALEAQGIMVYDRNTGQESHTMWMIKPAVARQISLDLPEALISSLGVGAEILARHLTALAENGLQDQGQQAPPAPILCRICERQITPWWFERHSELCLEEHRAERDVQDAQEALQEQRSLLVKVLDALETQANALRAGSNAPEPAAISRPEYKGLPIGAISTPPSGLSSGRSSPAVTSRSRESSVNGLSHHRARSFAVRRPLARIVELVLDLCDTAMEINVPSIKESKALSPGEIRTQSPQSESRIQQVLQWQSPSATSLENEQGLALLCDETSKLARSKAEHVVRHREILEYSERVRIEFDIMVQECIEATVQKVARIAAGELSESSDDSGCYETPEQGYESATENVRDIESIPPPDEGYMASSLRYSATPSAMSMALRNLSDPHLIRRVSSPNSSLASSPRGATTPKSHVFSAEPFSFHKRASIALESDAGAESDGSVRSSIASMSTGYRRSHSPSADVSLSRALSTTRSRERKRHSLVLSNLNHVSQRLASPNRGPPPPSSPLRIARPRISNEVNSITSPIISPILSTSDFNSPLIRAQPHHHRRQSSNALSDALGRPISPRLNPVVSNPQPRAVQTSIKDFEVIKPISKGAFGSVYLAKKKSTGDYYAIKVLKKADMVAKNQVNNVKAERHIMMWQGESDFVAKLYWTFSSKDYLYLVMEYLNGGDCASLIKVLDALPEDWTKKYIGEVVLCVQHLHSRAIVHRDLKPDNLLIDAKGHLKLTDFGLSRMGLIGRQKRAINAKPGDAPPDLLKSGPFRRAPSVTSSRSTSFDYHGSQNSPQQTPAMTPALTGDLCQPSYFSLNREPSREPSRRTSGNRSNSGDGDSLDGIFRRFSIADGRAPIEEEAQSENGNAGGGDSPDPYLLHQTISHSSVPKAETPPQTSTMPPPAMALFDPEDSNRRFVGTPDYLAPETISGAGQDEMSDWWSLGCILFECLYGRPPFNADTPQEVFQNILDRNIQWPHEGDDDIVSAEAKDLINKLMCSDPKQRLGANKEDRFEDGGEEIKNHPWFAGINWETLREDEASFVPVSENPEDTEYFDSRGATMAHFAPEFQDETTSPGITPGADYDRPHDALSRVRSQVNAVKRNLMPLHIPPHVRDARSRRLSEPVAADDFGNFQFKNLQVLEKANKDVIQKLRADALQAQSKAAGPSGLASPTVLSPSPGPSSESSPVMPIPLQRAKSHGRPHSPSISHHHSPSPHRISQPSSPLLVSFGSGQAHERRKVSNTSSNLSHQSSAPGHTGIGAFEHMSRLPPSLKPLSSAPSPAKSTGLSQGPSYLSESPRQLAVNSPRQRSHTVGSHDGDFVPELLHRHKRRSGVFDISPSSSDNEESRHQKALLRVQRRRQSSRRLSQISLIDGPTFRTLDVLVCEDHPVSRLVMERLLEKLRCRTIAVTNGSEAMRYAMSEVKFDIIMMEYKLPQVNGADVARMIRDTRNANAHTPIVAVTGYLKELHAPHHFDALVEKPPTKEKLEDVMGRLCQWKAPPEGWKPAAHHAMPPSTLRHENSRMGDSPTASSDYTRYSHDPSFRGSSREDSVTSNSISEVDSQYDPIPVIISRQPTIDWDAAELERNFGGLGITSPTQDRCSPAPQFSATPLSDASTSSSTRPIDINNPPGRLTAEAAHSRRHTLDRNIYESAAESGDDEDDEMSNVFVRARSPKRHIKRTSKLGIEMMRTNSQGSVVSNEDVAMKRIWDTVPIAEQPAAVIEAYGHVTPPEKFSPQPGKRAETIDMAVRTPAQSFSQVWDAPDPDATPRPQSKAEVDVLHTWQDPSERHGST